MGNKKIKGNNGINLDKICNFIDGIGDEIVNFTLDCVKQPSETPPGDETAIARLIIKKAIDWGLGKPKILTKKKNRPNIIISLNGSKKSKKGKKLIFSGHLDTVPLGDSKKWKVIDSKNPAIVGDRIYGRGSTDMKGALAGMLAAAYAIRSTKMPFNGELELMFTADEEAECDYGAKYLTGIGFDADAIIVGEPSGEKKNFDTIGITSKGIMLGKILVRGTQIHSSISDRVRCINASVKMAEVLLKFSDDLKKNLRFEPQKLYPLGQTITPGVTLEIWTTHGVVPGLARFGFDIRVIPGMKFETLRKDIENFLKKIKKADKDLDAELVFEKPSTADAWLSPAEIDEKHPIVEICINSAQKILGYKPLRAGVPFSTEASFYINRLGIPSVSSFGPGFIKLAHGPDEYVETKSIIDAAKIYAITALEYFGDYI